MNEKTDKKAESPKRETSDPVSILAPSFATPSSGFNNIQKVLGNQGALRYFKAQAKLSVSNPDDIYEQEADRVADIVMRMPDPQVQRASEEEKLQTKPITPVSIMQRELLKYEDEKSLQAKDSLTSAPQVDSGTESCINSMRGGGQPLPASVRDYFEPRFGYDFGNVKVHTNSQAAEAAQAVNAKAFTIGNNLAFGAGQYSPESDYGKKLIAHELTHVVQQESGIPLDYAGENPLILHCSPLQIAREPDPEKPQVEKSTEQNIRIVRLDNNVIAEIGRGNAAVASTLRQLSKDPNVRLEMSRGVYLETTRVTGDMLAARKALIEKLNIKVVDEPIAQRMPTYQEYAQSPDFPTHGQPKVTGGENATLEDLPHIASAAAGGTGVELWSFDSRVQTNAAKLGVKVAPESNIPIYKNIPDSYLHILTLVPEVVPANVKPSGSESTGGSGESAAPKEIHSKEDYLNLAKEHNVPVADIKNPESMPIERKLQVGDIELLEKADILNRIQGLDDHPEVKAQFEKWIKTRKTGGLTPQERATLLSIAFDIDKAKYPIQYKANEDGGGSPTGDQSPEKIEAAAKASIQKDIDYYKDLETKDSANADKWRNKRLYYENKLKNLAPEYKPVWFSDKLTVSGKQIEGISSVELFLHEITHVIDEINKVPGVSFKADTANRYFAEFRANLIATGDYNKALELTRQANPGAEKFLKGSDPVEIYNNLKKDSSPEDESPSAVKPKDSAPEEESPAAPKPKPAVDEEVSTGVPKPKANAHEEEPSTIPKPKPAVDEEAPTGVPKPKPAVDEAAAAGVPKPKTDAHEEDAPAAPKPKPAVDDEASTGVPKPKPVVSEDASTAVPKPKADTHDEGTPAAPKPKPATPEEGSSAAAPKQGATPKGEETDAHSPKKDSPFVSATLEGNRIGASIMTTIPLTEVTLAALKSKVRGEAIISGSLTLEPVESKTPTQEDAKAAGLFFARRVFDSHHAPDYFIESVDIGDQINGDINPLNCASVGNIGFAVTVNCKGGHKFLGRADLVQVSAEPGQLPNVSLLVISFEYSLPPDKISGEIWNGLKVNCEVQTMLKLSVTPDKVALALEAMKKFAPQLARSAAGTAARGIGEILASGPAMLGMLGAYITVKATLASLSDADEMKAVIKDAENAVQGYAGGFSSVVGGKDVAGSSNYHNQGAADGARMLSDQVKKAMERAAGAGQVFETEEIRQAIIARVSEQPDAVYDAIYKQSQTSIREHFIEAWKKNLSMARKIFTSVERDEWTLRQNMGLPEKADSTSPQPDTPAIQQQQPVKPPSNPLAESARANDAQLSADAMDIKSKLDKTRNIAAGARNRLDKLLKDDSKPMAIDAHNRAMEFMRRADEASLHLTKNATELDWTTYGFAALKDYESATDAFKEGIARYS